MARISRTKILCFIIIDIPGYYVIHWLKYQDNFGATEFALKPLLNKTILLDFSHTASAFKIPD